MTAQINRDELRPVDYAIGCLILSTSVRSLFDRPDIQEEYRRWLETEEGKAANRTQEETKSC